MTIPVRRLTLLIPGLLESLPETFGRPVIPDRDTAVLKRFLGRADWRSIPVSGFEETLLFLFSAQCPSNSSPVAALAHLGESGQRDEGWWLRADPVHVEPDQNRLLLFGERELRIRADEAEQLIAELNDHYAGQGWFFEAAVPGRWYLKVPDEPAITGKCVREVLGRDINRQLPGGDHARRWRSLLNETQMLLHSSSVNQARAQVHLPSVNSVWFWGAGRLPDVVRGQWDCVFADEPIAKGLAIAGESVLSELPADANACIKSCSGEYNLVVLDGLDWDLAYGDSDAWVKRLGAICQNWVVGVLGSLRAGELDEVELFPGNGYAYRLTRRQLRKFWRSLRFALPWQSVSTGPSEP